MTHVGTIMWKEFRGYFSSPVAYFFLLCFIGASLTCFFYFESFFAANRAEMRGFFEWAPRFLLLLIPGITMKLWAEEKKLGTLEILMTLPVRRHEMVLGKFLGGLLLLAVGLVATLGVPVTVAALGDIDMGPVAGGYFGTLLLGAAYLSIGLFMSSLVSDQFMALLLAGLACVLFWFIGTEPVLEIFSPGLRSLFQFVGFGNRFTSISRGVVDLRDVAYYVSVTAFFLFLNVGMLNWKRWS